MFRYSHDPFAFLLSLRTLIFDFNVQLRFIAIFRLSVISISYFFKYFLNFIVKCVSESVQYLILVFKWTNIYWCSKY